MPIVTYVQPSGETIRVEVAPGLSIMEGAVRNNITGIDADCGGACACATCHVYVSEDWVAVAGEVSAMEESMLEFADKVRPNSRLSCQIRMTDALDGLAVTVVSGR